MSLKNASLNFMRACQIADPKSLFAEYTKTDLEKVAKHLTLSEDLYEWYAIAAPKEVSISWIVNSWDFFEPSKLLEAQLGYRWFGRNTLNIETLEKLDKWHDEWIVIASIGGEPIITKVDKKPYPILIAYDGIGYWKIDIIAPNLESFLDFLSEWCNLIKEYKGVQNMLEKSNLPFDMRDKDSLLLDTVLERLKEIIELTVGEEYLENMMKYLS